MATGELEVTMGEFYNIFPEYWSKISLFLEILQNRQDRVTAQLSHVKQGDEPFRADIRDVLMVLNIDQHGKMLQKRQL